LDDKGLHCAAKGSKSPFYLGIDLNGISFQESEFGLRHITDGTSKSYLLAEKFLDKRTCTTRSELVAWCVTAYLFRAGRYRPFKDRHGGDPFFQGHEGSPFEHPFGSALPAGFNMSFCDGSVRLIEYDIEPEVHVAASDRHDGWVPGGPIN